MRSLLAIIVLLFMSAAAAGQDAEFAEARQLFQKGRYEESFEKFSRAKVATDQVIGQANCLSAIGKTGEAIARLDSFLEDAGAPSPEVHAHLAYIYFAMGEYDKSRKHVASTLSSDEQNPRAMFAAAELERVTGRIDEAARLYDAITQLPQDQLSVDEQYWVGRALTLRGRWNRTTEVFDKLVNEFYPSLLERDETFWLAHFESGKLFLEKYNAADAARELNAALSINPRAAEVHVALGQLALLDFDLDKAISSVERALRINPNLVSALQLTADIAFTNLQPNNAVEPLRQATQQNAVDESTLGRTLAVYLRQDGFESTSDEESRASQLIHEVTDRNPHCGHFFAAAGESFDALRLYPMAHKYYSQAIERLPELVSTHGKLGLVQMRLGQEQDAKRTLTKSFDIDPFNVRVKNSLEVLDLLENYAVIETDHFIIRFDRGQDGLLAEYAARYLEKEVYPDIVRAMDFEPPEKTLLEIFSAANGTTGHSWFSARMVGLPFIGTVGACAGKMFALTSPADGKSYNWARVLRHEFVHVVNLQQTNFLIPHWFTEALAVRNEMGGYPAEWDQILAKYVSEDNLFTLTNINHGFVRPGTSERWTLAYFQAYLYADFIEQRGGETALPKMLQHYAEGKSTEEALQEVLKSSGDDFEKEYREFLDARVQGSGHSELDKTGWSIESLRRELEEKPKDATLLAKLSATYGIRGNTRDARRYAERALALDVKQALANYVMARLMFSVGEDEKAWQHIRAGLDQEQPDPKLLAFAADLKFQSKEYDKAAEYYRVGQKKFEYDFSWTRGLARVHLAKNDVDELAFVLTQIADRDADRIPIARKMTQLSLQKKDFAAAETWANRVLHVDVMDPMAHGELAQALDGQGRKDEAIREYKTALKLAPREQTWKRRLESLQKERTEP